MKTCLVLFFSLFDLSSGSKVACLCCYQIWIKVNAEMKIPQRAQYWLL